MVYSLDTLNISLLTGVDCFHFRLGVFNTELSRMSGAVCC
jgi:hypothetical protein